jgi:hypothetical protein
MICQSFSNRPNPRLWRLGRAAASVVHVWDSGVSSSCLEVRFLWPGSGKSPVAVGSPAEHALLADKKAAAELLAGAGSPVTPLAMTILRGQATDPADPVWSQPSHLFVKPRRGSASRGTVALEVLPTGSYRMNDDSTTSCESLRDQLTNLSLHELDAFWYRLDCSRHRSWRIWLQQAPPPYCA